MRYAAILATFVLCIYVGFISLPVGIYLLGTDDFSVPTFWRVVIGGACLATMFLAGAVGVYVVTNTDVE